MAPVTVEIQVEEGWLKGDTVENEFGGTYASFKGIPYAEPPVEGLRFKAPVPKKSWTGFRSAKEHGSESIQIDMLRGGVVVGSEDCLYLNVYSPYPADQANPLPVMVYIHGGAFTHGSGNDEVYGPQFLVRNNVVVVTINYRVEALGFLCLDTEDIPGNAGMKDQVLALKWVKNNIKQFGGDPENITIFGESAGGASTSYHLVSPMSKGLFNKAIVQSGALTCFWAQTYEPRERALKLAKDLGCNSTDDKEIAEFFKTVPADKLIGLKLPVTQSTKPYELSFAIVDEKDFGQERFFYGDQIDVIKKGVHDNVKVMTGYTEHEGLIVFAMCPFEEFIGKVNEFKEFFVPKPIQLNCSVKQQLEVARKIKEFYLKKEDASKENFDQLLTFINWDMFIHGGLLLAKLISNQTDVFLYKLTCKSERNVFAHLFGLTNVIGTKPVVCHADDLLYLFPFSVSKLVVDKNSEAFKHIDKITTLWTNFAKFGNPTPDSSLGVKWPTYTLSEKSYLNIGNQLEVGTKPDAEDEAFWDDIFKQYLPGYVI